MSECDVNEVLPPEWFARDALVVARDLLGASLCRRHENGTVDAWAITEVEAYIGPEDRACHAHKGRTKRTEVMFGPSGVWYVYFCYGIHWLANIVTGPVDYPAAVLLRGAGALAGPARLTKRLGIDGSLNGKVASPASGCWISRGPSVPDVAVEAGPRVGVDYAGEEWAGKPFRFIWSGAWAGPNAKRKRG
jgi:DNA-3-methyladenine glycosylase